jgi:phage head maturation protease
MDAPIDAAGTLVTFGGEVKALGGNRVGGHVVIFGGPESADLSAKRDYFTPATDFGLDVSSRSAVLYHHGLKAPLGRRVLGVAELKADDVGIWAEAELRLRDDYERKVYELAEAGKLGWSTGTASHLVERKSVGEGVHEVTRWPLALDASLTPTPCDYRTAATSLKAIMDSESVGTMDAQAEAVHTAVAAWRFRLDDIARMRTVQGKAPVSDRWMAEIKSLRDDLDQLLIRSVPKARIEDVCSLEASFIETCARLSGAIGS